METTADSLEECITRNISLVMLVCPWLISLSLWTCTESPRTTQEFKRQVSFNNLGLELHFPRVWREYMGKFSVQQKRVILQIHLKHFFEPYYYEKWEANNFHVRQGRHIASILLSKEAKWCCYVLQPQIQLQLFPFGVCWQNEALQVVV